MPAAAENPGSQSTGRTRRVRIAKAAVVGILTAGAVVFGVYARDMRRAYARLANRSAVVPSPYGDIEYSEGGTGPPVLVVHGSGGGFDQGEILAEATLGPQFRWIAPSRFGYLRSTFRPGATFDDQAHAYAALLEHLHVDRVAVVALSHGGPSALLFALLHPDRVTSLTLISAGVTISAGQRQDEANRKGTLLTAIFRSDVRYWAVTRVFRRQLLELMGAADDVIDELTPQQRRLADLVIDAMNPVSRRSAGVLFDHLATMPNERIAKIRVPTLILHAKDDLLQVYHNAEFAAASVPQSRLVAFDKGGHLLLAVEQPVVQREVERHILNHAH